MVTVIHIMQEVQGPMEARRRGGVANDQAQDLGQPSWNRLSSSQRKGEGDTGRGGSKCKGRSSRADIRETGDSR